jgi:hypothetical protein
MKNPLLSQGRSHIVSRHGRMLSPAASELLRRIVADMRRYADTAGLAPEKRPAARKRSVAA